ncbi:MAG: hypothetical protein DHS20C18_37800 [Saprospiraceae bacterium]|nr:MAG: hypothetical protein DHS20C18_37800 [Saprospiraceae bacterium]
MVLNVLSAQATLLETYQKVEISKQQAYYLQQIKKRTTYIDHRLVYVNESLLTKEPSLNLDLFGNQLTVVKDKVINRKEGRYSWFGHCTPSFGTANFVVKGTTVSGMIRMPDYLYSIKSLGEGLHVLVLEDASRFPEDHPSGSYEKKLEQRKQKEEGNHDDLAKMENEKYCKIRIIVAYTDSVALQNADPLGEIQLATDNMNNANANSGVDHVVEIARVVRVSYTDSWDLDDDLDRFRSTADGVMDEIHGLRDLYDADLCQLVVSGALDGCGLADAIGSSFSNAFCVSAFGCISGNLTFAHEFGHLYNCRHDTYVDGSAGNNHGHVNLGSQWRTVMSYNDECDDNGFDCVRLQFWSNPSVLNSGEATGVVGTSENAAQMNTYEQTIRDFQAIPEVKTIGAPESIPNQELADFVAMMRVETSVGIPYIYQNGSEGAFHAYNEVVMKAGFHAQTGADFSAFIEDACTAGSSLVVADSGTEQREEMITDKMAIINPLAEESSIPNWTIYPNPNGGQLNLDFNLPTAAVVYLTIYDVAGKKIKDLETEVYMEAGQYQQKYQIDALDTGTYFVEFKAGGQRWIKPLVRVEAFE